MPSKIARIVADADAQNTDKQLHAQLLVKLPVIAKQEHCSHCQCRARQCIRCRTKTGKSPSGSLQCHSAAFDCCSDLCAKRESTTDHESAKNLRHTILNYPEIRSHVTCLVLIIDRPTVFPNHIKLIPVLRCEESPRPMAWVAASLKSIQFQITEDESDQTIPLLSLLDHLGLFMS
jgi:hypothetical protein